MQRSVKELATEDEGEGFLLVGVVEDHRLMGREANLENLGQVVLLSMNVIDVDVQIISLIVNLGDDVLAAELFDPANLRTERCCETWYAEDSLLLKSLSVKNRDSLSQLALFWGLYLSSEDPHIMLIESRPIKSD